MELTVREIDSAKPTNKQYKLADGRGLCLLVMPSGGKYGPGANRSRSGLEWSFQRTEDLSGQGEQHRGVVCRAALRPRSHHSLCALVLAVQAQLPGSG